ncbi:MAG TPA: hypothetical protein IAD32_08210 [Candidatus Scatavimonas merdigallinarum]|uniref:Uncharacterized protein n=1 Tax=Candidatus Scatavimonas merdigallinarum TaxID=2840914 RepID=A0A9D1CUS7_9FIRM|nr:hypothetical protein [Candidatus Scatavimonas merdigallinarum]
MSKRIWTDIKTGTRDPSSAGERKNAAADCRPVGIKKDPDQKLGQSI